MSRGNESVEYDQIGEATQQYLEDPTQDDSNLQIFGYKQNTKRKIVFYIINIVLLCVPLAIITWFPSFKKLLYQKCSLKTADLIFISNNCGKCDIATIITETTELPATGLSIIRYFLYQHTKYVWMTNNESFLPLEDVLRKETLESILEESHGLLESEEDKLLHLFGPNTIDIEVKSYWRLFIEEVFNPFYIFQAFSFILWFFDDYIIYAFCVLFLTLFSIITTLIQTRKQSVALHDLVTSTYCHEVQIKRRQIMTNLTPIMLNPEKLVPGHLIIIPKGGFVMPCDAVLLTGNCIVNESMLTGESVPVVKTPPNANDEIYNPIRHKDHTLFSGTHVIQGRYYNNKPIFARVTKTGFNTTKGALIKSIMYPAPIGFKFYKDSLKFVFVLFIIAAIGMVYCLYLYWERKAEIKEMIIRTLDIITIVVPPALPAAMSVGIVYSQTRLKKLGIYCISPPRINICGKIKLACFDKTGTLTNDGLEFYSALPASKGTFLETTCDVPSLDVKLPFVQAMASCHSLTRIDGDLNGDPLDLSMFDSTNWIMEEPGKEETNFDVLAPTVVKPIAKQVTEKSQNEEFEEVPYEIGIIRQFQFSSALQRMSVICRVLGSRNMVLYTKGAPEKIQSMCLTNSIPDDFECKLAQYTAQGFRVIALAYKPLPVKLKWKESQKIKRETVECDLIFLGFIVMQNTLKQETSLVINTLLTANIRTVMITGDNIMTAISVARECGMVRINDDVFLLKLEDNINPECIPKIFIEKVGNTNNCLDTVINFNHDNYHFAIDGITWTKLRIYYLDLLPKILLKSTIFARFQPDHKTQLILSFQSLDYIVSMVGDGANDCGALKAAHVGVSLSQAEASVAAPFTSKIENITCLIHLICEGRCALVTSFAVFKYMALYSLIQFFTIIILYKNNSILGDTQFLFIDLIITTSLAVTIGRQGPSKNLVPKRPMGSLIAGTNLFPMMLQIFFCGLIQYTSLYYLKLQSWYEPNPRVTDAIITCWENTVLFIVSSYQYIILAVVYSKGKPYRQMLLTNFWMLFSCLILTAIITYLCVYPNEEISGFFEVKYLAEGEKPAEHIFRDTILLFPISHFIIAVLIEVFLSESVSLKKFIHFVTRKKRPKNRYKLLLQEMNMDDWFHTEKQ